MREIVRAGITAVSATTLLDRALSDDRTRPSGPLRVVAAGKASHAMAAVAARRFGSAIRDGLVISHVPADALPGFRSMRGTHPVPGPESEQAGRAALRLATDVAEGETLLVLLSGGGSAIMAVPADGITLEDKRRTTDRLLKAGADIHALNTVRKHLSAVKGGWLAAQTSRPSMTLAISDVVGDDLSVIASGPTVADATTFADALAVVRRFGGVVEYPSAVIGRLEAGVRNEVAETPKPGNRRLTQAVATVIGGRAEAMTGAAREAAARGYSVVRLEEAVVGEARIAAVAHVRTALARAEGARRPTCIVSTGETVVHVTGSGKGGRNQEFALAAAEVIAGVGPAVVVASAGTDGIDGPTDAAGAIADSETLDRARRASIGPPASYLANNDAYAFFAPLGDLIVTGPTDTNVGDLQIVLIG